MSNIPVEDRKEAILMKLERSDTARFYRKARLTMGAATFFDAFDMLSIAYAIPVLMEAWHLSPPEVGALITSGFVGQIIGAITFGAAAERFGRVKTASIAIAIMAIVGIGCGFAQSYLILYALRFLQGIGIGGQIPVAATYINEIAIGKKRGKTFLLYELSFVIGLLMTAFLASWLVPRFGWRPLFFIGGAPLILSVAMWRILPESPRWLVARGQYKAAENVMRVMTGENSYSHRDRVPREEFFCTRSSRSSIGLLVSRAYRGRTMVVWVIWAVTGLVNYGVVSWLPTLYRKYYHLSLADSLHASLIASFCGLAACLLCALSVDVVGRRNCFVIAFLTAAVALGSLWWYESTNIAFVVVCATVAYAALNTNALLVYLYTPEIYPTEVRALGTGVASSILRISAALGPVIIGNVLPHFGMSVVFCALSVVALCGAVAAVFALETKGQRLEDVGSLGVLQTNGLAPSEEKDGFRSQQAKY
ncbi:MFS transporter [Paraburkholderia hospita]|uniref:MFS transporter n=1 Tax=Paraburkholderia hospita TaxID=169430 RepID=UPI000271A51E|nr:MFS transporter [Paraburkholderia hospita]EUC18772.1 General substrate transporter [Burkholderia sp. BT03]SKC61290.1 Sugar phosphate permease [Paraburkholderia hospita]